MKYLNKNKFFDMLKLKDIKYKKHLFHLLAILILLIIEYYINDCYKLCSECYNNYKKEKKCQNCKITIIFKGLKIASDEETLDEIIKKNKSISRFGDGEFKIIFGFGIGFQKKNTLLY